MEGYLGRFDWVQQANSLARPIIYTTTVMDKSLGTLCISGAFSNSHWSNPSPHPTINAGRVYPEFFFRVSTLCRVGGGQTAKKIEKDALFYEGSEKWKKNMNSAALSKGLLSTIVALKFKFQRTLIKSGLPVMKIWQMVS